MNLEAFQFLMYGIFLFIFFLSRHILRSFIITEYCPAEKSG
jgi:hypothetical protein